MKHTLLLPLSFAIFLSLTACADSHQNKAKSKPVINKTPVVVLSSADDPDGDNDNKGVNHFSQTRPATGKKVFIFDPNFNAWAVYDENGERMNTGRASGGQLYCPDVGRECKTITGQFTVFSKGSGDCISNKYPLETNGGAPMPYCMYFQWRGYAIHGSNDVPNHNASHGCIRVTPLAAKWLSENMLNIGSTVIVLTYAKA